MADVETTTGTPKDNLSAQASKGILWNVISSFSVSAIRFGGTAVLARILIPADFGIVGMAYVAYGIVYLFGNLGLGTALVQKQADDIESLSTAFWANTAINILLALSLVGVAPLAASYFDEPALFWVIISLGVNFILSGITSTHAVLLYKELRFKDLAKIEIACTVLRVIVVLICALNGLRYWSIIIASLVERFVKTLFFYWAVKWKPALFFDFSIFKQLFAYSWSLFADSFVRYINQNMDYIVTGKVLGAAQLGIYQFAFNFPNLINEHISRKVREVLFPVFSKVKDDTTRCRRGFAKAIRFVSIITFPVMAGLVFTADSFVLTIYGHQWVEAINPMRILALASMLQAMVILARTLLMSLGRPDIIFKFSLTQAPLTILAIIYFSRWGLPGVAWAMVFSAAFALIPILYCMRMVKMSIGGFLRCLTPSLICSSLMLSLLYLLSMLLSGSAIVFYLQLAINITIGAVVYMGFLYLFFKNELFELIEFAKGFMPKKSPEPAKA